MLGSYQLLSVFPFHSILLRSFVDRWSKCESMHLSSSLVYILNTDNIVVFIEVERLLGGGSLSWVFGAEDLIKFLKLG
tara:strand:+ start:480 stop:713 length:234 start_codon:yes stop_codon:yes gene_type:complete